MEPIFPESLNIETTNRCNLKCVMCPRYKMTRAEGTMDMELYRKIVADCSNHVEHIKVFNLFMDGEPLLDNLLEERIRIAKKAGIRFIEIATNGMLLTESRAKSLVESGLDSIIIALEDIDKDVHERIRRGCDYNRVISNLENLISVRNEAGSTRPEITVRMLALGENNLHREAFLQHWKTKVEQIIISPAHNWGGAVSIGEKVSHRNTECCYLWKQVVILIDGTVALCCVDYDGVHKLGNVRHKSIYDIWHGAKFKEYRQRFENNQIDLCNNCNWIPGSVIAHIRPAREKTQEDVDGHMNQEKENAAKDILEQGFDRYTRYLLIAKVTDEVRTKTPMRILDAGGAGGLLGNFLKKDKIVIMDTVPASPDCILGDITHTPFESQSFDLVISSDVYEHIPSRKRAEAIAEMLRLSRNIVILGAPFYSPEVEEAEVTANNFWLKATGEPHRWLREHIENKLPYENELESILKECGYDFYKFGTNNLPTWLMLMLFSYYAQRYQIPQDKVGEVWHFYNENFADLGDFEEPTYRKIYLIGKRGTLPQVSLYKDSKVDRLKQHRLTSLVFDTILEATAEKVSHIADLNSDLQARDSQISNLETNLQEKGAQISSLEASLQEKASQIASLEASIQERGARINNLETSLQEKVAQISSLETNLQEKGAQISSLETSLQEKVSRIASLETTLQQKASETASLQTGIQEKVSRIASLETSLQEKVSRTASLEVEIQQIQRGIVVQLVNRYQRIVEKLLRPSTHRRYYYELVLTGIRVILNEGWKSFFSAVKRRLWLMRAMPKAAPLHLPEFTPSISKKEAEELKLPKPSKRAEVSIVIPAYDKLVHTLNCLRAILQNTDGDYEVVVIDDASTDETRSMLSKVRNLRLVKNKQNVGFVESCNRGARAGDGKYILFLNNDTMVTKGWLPPLLEVIKREDVGAVGSKLVYPDGKLQEAGGLIWNDGTGWNYGRGDNLEKPEYNYVREVDYCSGACLLVKRELFEKIGGFDERFKPAYCEDTDLCFSLRKLGYKVMYQPVSVVVHFEGITCGTDTSSGIKRYQEINRQKFVEKWGPVLQECHYHPVAENAFWARDRVLGKRILVIDHYVPTYDQDAGSESTFNILKLLSELGHKVTFIGDNLLNIQPYTTSLQQNRIEVIYAPYVLSVEEYIKRHGRYFDVVILSRPHIAIKYLNSIKRNCDRAKIIYDTKDLVYIRESRRAEVEKDKKVLKLAEESKKTEFYLAENTDLTLVVSPEEKKILVKDNPRLNVEVLRHVLPVIKQPKKPFSERKDLLYVGGFQHIPNVDGAIYFVNEIFPGIKKRLPGVRLYIVGSNPPHEVSSLQSSDIIVTGFVKDMAPYFENCRVFVVPLRYGAGIKGKVIHSMIRGLPVVATSIGAEGIIEEVEEGKDILVADTKEGFVEKVVSLYTDEKLWNVLSESPLHYVEKNYSYEASRIRLKEILEKLCRAK